MARGVLAEAGAGTIVFAVPGTDYQMHLGVSGPLGTHVGKRLVGTIRVQARRVDVVKTGGRYIEPVMGRPRRIQGDVIAVNPGANEITVEAAVPIVAKLDALQRAEAFRVGDFVAFDATPGAVFVPGA